MSRTQAVQLAGAGLAIACFWVGSPASAQPTFDVGDLPPGKKITVKFQVTVNGLPAGVSPAALSNQGQLQANGGALTVPTDDPDTAAAGDPTLTQLDSLAVGGLVWKEQSGNLVFDSGTDAVVSGVSVNLYVDDGDGVLDPGDGSAIASGTTSLSGAYLFAGLTPGDYIVEIAASNFAPAAPLENFFALAGAADPDNDVKNDNNGSPVGASVASSAVTLAFNAEPTTDGDTDTDTNLSVDFGFTDLADIEVVSKTDAPDPVRAGADLTYTVTLRNNGPGAARAVTVTDPTPTGTTFVSAAVSTGVGWAISAPAVGGTGNVVFSKASVGPSETAVFQIVVKVDPALAAAAVVTNTATAATTSTDPTPGNQSKMATSTVEVDADLSMDKSDSGADAIAGSTYTYTLEVTNNGPSNSSGSTVTDTLPAGWSFAASSNGTCSGDGGNPETVTCSLGALTATQMSSFTITASLPASEAPGTRTNNASVSGDDPDSDSANDADSEPTDVVAEVDLSIGKSDDVDPATPGGAVVYTIDVTNAGPSDAAGVVVTETLPAGVSLVSTAGCAEDPAGVPTCTLGTIASGSMKSYTVTVTVTKPVAAGVVSVVNQVSVATSATDTNAANDSATESTAIVAAPDLTLSKDDGGVASFPGGVILYDLSYANAGDQDATGVKISETVPANTTFNEAASGGPGVWTCADGSPAGTTCEHLVGGLGGTAPVAFAAASGADAGRAVTNSGNRTAAPVPTAGGSVTFAVTVDPGVALGLVPQIDNTAMVEDDAGNGVDPNPGDNSAQDQTPLPVDFGDAPDPTYPTLLATSGARHAIGGGLLFLGASVDGEADGQPSVLADGDDLGGADDEDGVIFLTPIVSGATADVQVIGSAAGLLNAWVDFDGDGGFDPGDQVFADQPLAAGVNALSFAVPTTSFAGETFARFRLDSAGGLAPTGQATDGEVEDYQVGVNSEADLGITLAQSNDAPAGGSIQLYTMALSNAGPAEATGVVAQIVLPAGATYLGGEPASAGCAAVGGTTIDCAIGSITAGGSATVTVGAQLDARLESAWVVAASVSGTRNDPVPGNDTDQVTTTQGRGRVLAAVEYPGGSGTRRLLAPELAEGDETLAFGVYQSSDGANDGYHVSGIGYRAVDVTGLADISGIGGVTGTPAPEVAVLGHGFGGSVRVSMFDSDSQALLAEHSLDGIGIVRPVAIAAAPDFDSTTGTTAPELVVLAEDPARLVVVDAANGAVVRDHTVSGMADPVPLFVAVVPDFGDSPAPELAVALRNPATGEAIVRVFDADTGAMLLDQNLGGGLFPLGLAAVDDLGGGPAGELALLARKADDGSLRALVFDAANGVSLNTVQFSPSIVPGPFVAVENFGGSVAGELAVAGRDGALVRVEVRDAGSGILMGSHTETMPAATPVALALAPLSDSSGGPAQELALLYEFLGMPPRVDLFHAAGGPPLLSFSLP